MLLDKVRTRSHFGPNRVMDDELASKLDRMKPAVILNRRDSSIRNTCIALACWVIGSACSGPATGPEEQLRMWVSQGTSAAEAKDRRELVSMISPAYEDSRGNDLTDIENSLRAYFFRQNDIKLLTSIQEIRLFGDSAAEIDLTVGMAGKSDGVLGFRADAYKFRLELQRDDDEWQLISARWVALGEELR